MQSPLGLLEIKGNNDAIVCVNFKKDLIPETADEELTDHPLLVECHNQLNAYFTGRLKTFHLPLRPAGTDFQLKIWELLQRIPFGKTISYMQLAKQTGNVKTIRAAGTANGKNPIPIIIPCHRVIGANGTLVGYSGEMWRKKWLIDHEDKWANGVQSLFE
jgi:methylated-DNA-[protein]-cysteine S-methyltransferase